MHRLLAVLFSFAVAIAGGWVVAVPGPATAQVPLDDPRLGLVYDGLRKTPMDSFCAGAFEAVLDVRHATARRTLCTHGPDPAPEGVDVREDRGPDPTAELFTPSPGTAADTGAVGCHGTGSDGFRVQLVYARSSSGPDRFGTYAASFRSWAGRLDQVVQNSAAKTGGTRRVRFVTDATCNPVVERVTLTSGAMSNFATMVSELVSLGYARSDRKYLVWADANVYCGISELYVDDTADPTPGRNYNNGHPRVQGTVGRVDNRCWGLSNMVEAHELVHLLGGVQKSAPHATPSFHCLDEADRLCYDDGSSSSPVRQVCPPAHEALYDCNSDDYFSTAPPPGSYLATHWNTANSAFLSAEAPAGAPTTTTTTVVPPPPATTTTGPTQTTTTQPAASDVPSAPRSLSARQPTVGGGIALSWEPPTSGPVTGYRIYRGTSPYAQALLTSVGNVQGYSDVTAGPTIYYYRVAAYNAAGDGPLSSIAGMLGKTATAAGAVREDTSRRVISSTQLRSAWGVRWA
ncbi:MAG: fibronectin type III domain-containing protein [Actinomycetota bacterium]|nr:fibronectin type III domain-containing protein [Actinomycetota bacterium]